MSEELKKQILQDILKSNVHIGQFIMEVKGDNHYHAGCMNKGKTSISDEQISKAIISINGKNKPLNEKQLFLGIICVLLSKYGWTGNWSSCCERINSLPMKEQFYKECDYNSIKIITAYKFASVDYKEWSSYEPKTYEQAIFKKCKAAAEAFDEALHEQIE
jgi:hypothetical protein